MSAILATAIIADGNTGVLHHAGGASTVFLYGTWGTGSPAITIQWSPDGTNWFSVLDSAGAALTLTSTKPLSNITLGGGQIRGVLAGSTGASLVLGIAGAFGSTNRYGG